MRNFIVWRPIFIIGVHVDIAPLVTNALSLLLKVTATNSYDKVMMPTLKSIKILITLIWFK